MEEISVPVEEPQCNFAILIALLEQHQEENRRFFHLLLAQSREFSEKLRDELNLGPVDTERSRDAL